MVFSTRSIKCFMMIMSIVHFGFGIETSVTSVSPSNNALNISTTTTIQVTFSSSMQESLFNDTTSFIVSGSISGRHRGTIVLSGGQTIATFTPTTPFLYGERVEVALTSNLLPSSGPSLTPHVSTFTVQYLGAVGIFTFDRSYTTGDSPFGLGIGDMNGDGYGDLATTNTNSTGISTFRQLANGYFDSKVDYQTGANGGLSTYPYSVVIADLNGDGASDMAVGNCNSNKLSILINNGNGTYAARVEYASGSGPGDVIASDLDGDGDKDIALAVKATSSAYVYLNNGDGTLAAGISYTAGSYASGIAANDIDNDGDQDLVTANEGTNTLSVLKNNGNATFASPIHLTAASGPLSVDAGDLNGDGYGDLVCGNQGGGSISVFVNNGSGGFGTATNYALSNYGRGAMMGDLDGDGDLDIIVGVDGTGISIFRNNGDGSFAARVDYTAINYAVRVAIADLDRNGVADIVATGSGNKVYVHRGTGIHDAALSAPSNITETSATINGTVTINSDTAVVRFLIGTSTGVYTDSVLATQSPISDSTFHPVSVSKTGLSSLTTYYVRIAVNGPTWYLRSHEMSFSTASTDSTASFAMTLDGVNDHVNVPYDAALNPSEFTVELWARVDGGAGTYRTPIASRRANASVLYGYNMYATNTNRWSAWIGPGTNTWCSIDGGPVTNGTWTHLAMTHDGTRFRFYVDGVLKGDTIVTFSPNTANPLRFGSASDANAFYFNGRIDEVRIWNIARDSTVIRQSMHHVINSSPSNLVANWHFQEGSGALVTDGEGGKIGTLTNIDNVSSYTWPLSTIPAGPGTVASASLFSSGSLNLGSVSLTTTDAFDSPIDLTVTQITTVPNVFPIGYSGVVGNSSYLINTYGAAGSFSVNFTITYGSGVLNPQVDAYPQSLRLYTRSSSSDGSWTEVGGATSANSTTGGVTWTGLTVFSQFAAVYEESALPVELLSFTATSQRLNAELKWRTATEVNNLGFEIERRVESDRHLQGDGHLAWAKIGFVDGNGTSNSPKEYSFTDKNLSAGKFSYRLKQIDRDGKFEYSNEVEVTVGSALLKFEMAQNYPNPFNPSTTIGFTLQVSGLTTLKIYDIVGREVTTLVNDDLEAGVYYQKQFDAGHLASGIYFAKLSSGGKSQMKRLMLMK